MDASVGARPVLSLADEAAERAAFQAHGVRALLREIAAEHLAFLGAVDLPGPLVGAVRLHAEHDRHADDRAAAMGGVRIVLVEFRLARLRIVRLLEPDDGAAQGPAAVGDPHPRAAVLRKPSADRIGGRDVGETEHGKRNSGGAQNSHGKAPHLVRLLWGAILPSLRPPHNRQRTTGNCNRPSSARFARPPLDATGFAPPALRAAGPTPPPRRARTRARAPDW